MGQGIPEERLKNESITAVQYREDYHDVNIHVIDDDLWMNCYIAEGRVIGTWRVLLMISPC